MMTRFWTNSPTWGFRDAFSQLNRLREQMDLLSDVMLRGRPVRSLATTGVFPSINLTEDPDKYYVRAELPGMKADALDIQVVGRNLTISGERNIQSIGEQARYHRREREAGKFSRVIGLPGEIDTERVEAQLVNGMLQVVIPKAEVARPKQITIK